jgi:hypothetical protein
MSIIARGGQVKIRKIYTVSESTAFTTEPFFIASRAIAPTLIEYSFALVFRSSGLDY